MGTVNNYENDGTLSVGDKLLGTDVVTGKQKNYTLGEIVSFILDNYVDGDGNIDLSSFIQNPMITDLSAGDFKITDLANGTLDADAINRSQLAEVYDFTNSRNKVAGEITSGAAIPAFGGVSFASAQSYIKLVSPDTGDVGYVPVYQDITAGSTM